MDSTKGVNVFWTDLWSVIAWFFWLVVMIAYLMALFSVITDLFRDRETSGWVKAIWIVFLIFVPFLTALVYLIVRGDGMARRGAKEAAQEREAAENYLRDVAGTNPADQIEKAHQLLAAGVISQPEFDELKRKALA